MKLVIDINLSPGLVSFFESHGIQAVHWSRVGDPCASDLEIMQWALKHDYVVFTHDLDFGTTLAVTHKTGPSVIQVRAEDVLAEQLAITVITALKQHQEDIQNGAIVVVDEKKSRVRVLPINNIV